MIKTALGPRRQHSRDEANNNSTYSSEATLITFNNKPESANTKLKLIFCYLFGWAARHLGHKAQKICWFHLRLTKVDKHAFLGTNMATWLNKHTLYDSLWERLRGDRAQTDRSAALRHCLARGESSPALAELMCLDVFPLHKSSCSLQLTMWWICLLTLPAILENQCVVYSAFCSLLPSFNNITTMLIVRKMFFVVVKIQHF